MHLMGSGLAHAPMLPCAATSRANPALPVRSSQPACTSSRAALHCRGVSKSFGSFRLSAIRPPSRCVILQARRRGCFDLSASECRNAPNTSRRKTGACRPVAASSAAPIDPNFPAPAAPRSQLDKVADVLTTLFPVWVSLRWQPFTTRRRKAFIRHKVHLFAGVPRSFHWYCQATVSSLVQQWLVYKSAWIPHALHGPHTHL